MTPTEREFILQFIKEDFEKQQQLIEEAKRNSNKG